MEKIRKNDETKYIRGHFISKGDGWSQNILRRLTEDRQRGEYQEMSN